MGGEMDNPPMKFRFLGTGTSVGVPQIGCRCAVCTSADPRDRRRRCGVYVTAGDTGFLVDTPPELREACLAHGVDNVQAVVLTHAHMDHVAGFDDVRRFNTLNGTREACDPSSPGANGRTFRVRGRALACYAMPETIKQMRALFPYVRHEGGENGLFRPQIDFVADDAFSIGPVRVERLRVGHGFPCCGYLFNGSLAYMSDCHDLPDETVDRLRGVGTLVIDCLREREHPTHLSWPRARAYIERIAPRRAFLTHLCHDFSHVQWLEKLAGTPVEPAYDGLCLEEGVP
jgi:phosphoribosyl 1,2-cyclic phosphate phosphodiesterase